MNVETFSPSVELILQVAEKEEKGNWKSYHKMRSRLDRIGISFEEFEPVHRELLRILEI